MMMEEEREGRKETRTKRFSDLKLFGFSGFEINFKDDGILKKLWESFGKPWGSFRPCETNRPHVSGFFYFRC